MEKEYEKARAMLVKIHTRCFPEIENFQPLPDLWGVLDQLDNMTCSMERRRPSHPNKTLLFAWCWEKFKDATVDALTIPALPPESKLMGEEMARMQAMFESEYKE